jgi:hypothetical protein
MTTLREAAQQALEALEYIRSTTVWQADKHAANPTIAALRAALAQQEPVAWTDRELELIDGMIEVQLRHAAQCDAIANRPMAERQKGWDMERVALLRKIKSSPPRREWRGLTMQEINALPEVGGRMWNMGSAVAVLQAIRAIEAALKEKNQ